MGIRWTGTSGKANVIASEAMTVDYPWLVLDVSVPVRVWPGSSSSMMAQCRRLVMTTRTTLESDRRQVYYLWENEPMWKENN